MTINGNVMVTKSFELTDDYRSITEFNMRSGMYVFDERLYMIAENVQSQNLVDVMYNYLMSFSTLTDREPDSAPAIMAKGGFVPIGIEPLHMVGKWNNTVIIPTLRRLEIPFFMRKQVSPIYNGYEYHDQAGVHDVWVSKLDLASRYNKAPWGVRVQDVWEEVINDYLRNGSVY